MQETISILSRCFPAAGHAWCAAVLLCRAGRQDFPGGHLYFYAGFVILIITRIFRFRPKTGLRSRGAGPLSRRCPVREVPVALEKKHTWRKWLWYFSLAAAAILLYKLSGNIKQIGQTLAWIFGIFAPFIGGFALAFFLYAPSRKLEQQISRLRGRFWKRFARPISLGIVYLMLFGLLSLLIGLLIPRLLSSLSELVAAFPRYLEAAQQRLEEFAQPGGLLDRFGMAERLDDIYAAVVRMVTNALSTENVLTAVKGVVNVTSSVLDVIIAVMVSIYMLAGRENLLREFRTVLGLWVKPRYLDILADYGKRISNIFYSYFFGSFVDALVVGIVVSIGLSVFRVPYAVLLGMAMGLLNMIPYFGAIIGSISIILITLLTKNIYAAIGVSLYLVVVQQVDGNIVQPRVVGNSVGLRPIYVLLSITVFGGLFGFWGIFLGVPLMAVIQMLVKEAVSRSRAKNAAAAEDLTQPPEPDGPSAEKTT